MNIKVIVPENTFEKSKLTDYGLVYLKDALAAIKDELPKLVRYADDSDWILSCSLNPDGSLRVTVFASDPVGMHTPPFYQFASINFFFVEMKFVEDSNNHLTFNLNPLKKHERCFHRSILDVAKCSDDEIGFLLDHEKYWTFRAKEVISYLTSEDNLTDERVLAKLPIFIDSDRLDYRSAALLSLKKAIEIPELKAMAKELIIKIAKPREESCTTYWMIRQSALDALSKLLDEPDVNALFHELSENDERHAIRTHALNLLESREEARANYQIELYKRMIPKVLPQGVNDEKNIFAFEYFIWMNSFASGHVCRSGLIDVNYFVELFKQSARKNQLGAHITGCIGKNPLGGFTSNINQTAALYSILKLIAYTCDDIDVFSLVTSALIEVAGNNRLGLLDRIGELLDDVCKNPRITPPERLAHLRKPRQGEKEDRTVESAILNLSRDRDFALFQDLRIEALNEILANKDIDDATRIVAIRETQKYFFTGHDYRWVDKEYQAYRDVLLPTLYKLAQDATKEEVGRAASQIINWYKCLPKNSDKVFEPTFWQSSNNTHSTPGRQSDEMSVMAIKTHGSQL